MELNEIKNTNKKGSTQQKKIIFLSDEPITSASEDKLNLSSYVDTIQRILLTSKTPLNIGLFGRWGVGKTSILNLLKERVTNSSLLRAKFDFFYLDAWKLSKESLRQQLLMELNSHFGKKAFTEEEIEDKLYNIREVEVEEEIGEKFVKRLRDALWQSRLYISLFVMILIVGYFLKPYIGITNFQLILSSILIPMFFIIVEKLDSATQAIKRSVKRVIPRIEYPHQFERMFKRILKERGNKTLIIAIDNLDRCEGEVVVEMLGTIKNFMNVPGCVFVLACDDEAIERHLCTKKGFEARDAREFLRKFFQAPIPIRPFLDEDLERFMDGIMNDLPIPFDEQVKEVLMAATTKNPRRVKQFLNSLISAYYLAEANEKNGLIRKGTITKNTGFLAKITVIRDEWPRFYKILERQEDILFQIEKYFRGDGLNQDESQEIDNYFEQNDGLEWFLKATRTIEVTDIAPFLKLSQESYERALPEHERFVRRVQFGDFSYVSELLSKLDEKTKINYIREILKTIDNDMKRKRFDFAFNGMHVLCEMFPEIPEEIKPDIVERFERYAPTSQIKRHLRKFSSEKLFSVLEKMREANRETILLYYCDLLVPVEKLNETLLDLFISRREILSNRVIDRINSIIVELYEKDEERALRILHTKFIPRAEVKEIMINERTVNAIVLKIDSKVSDINRKRTETFFHLKNIASPDIKKAFVQKMLSILSQKEVTAIDPSMQFALDALGKLEAEDIPADIFSELYDVVIKTGARMSSESHKLSFFKIVFKNFERLDQKRKDEFIQHYINPLITKGSQQTIKEIINSSRLHKVPLADYDPILNSLTQRVSTNLSVPELITFLITESPATQKGKVANMLVKMIQSNNNALVLPALEGFRKNFASFASDALEKVAKACLDTGSGRPVQEMKIFFDTIVATFEQCPERFKVMFVDRVLAQMKSDDLNLRENGKEYYEQIKEQIPKETRRRVLMQLRMKLVSIQDKIDASAKPLIDVIINDQLLLEEDDLIGFIDILIGQIDSTKPAKTQAIGLEAIRRLKKLPRRANQVLRTIFDLSRSSSEEIRTLCKEVLMEFSGRYKGPKGFWEEVKESFSDEWES
jgi:hypothetical protein